MDTKNFALAALAVTVGLVLHGAMYGPQASFFTELFGTRVRYSGVSVGYQLASIIAGGLAPFIAVALLKAYDSGYAISVYVGSVCGDLDHRRHLVRRNQPPGPDHPVIRLA